jgi:hypothetical protein
MKPRKGGIHLNPAHRGMLHEDLGVPMGEKIPTAKLDAAMHSNDPAIRKRANFAKNARGFNHAERRPDRENDADRDDMMAPRTPAKRRNSRRRSMRRYLNSPEF